MNFVEPSGFHSPSDVSSDDVGKETLEHLESFEAYAAWIYQKIHPFLGHRVLEVGSGVGTIIPHLLSGASRELMITDYREDYVDILQRKFDTHPNVEFFHFDATSPPDSDIQQNPPDTVICLNVLEHIKEDQKALSHMFDLLQPGGKCIILVPAFQQLYSKLDYYLEHYRRYNASALEEKMHGAGFDHSTSFYFNPVGAVGWFVSGRILKGGTIKPWHITFQRFLLPISQLVDKLPFPFGISVVCVGIKPETSA